MRDDDLRVFDVSKEFTDSAGGQPYSTTTTIAYGVEDFEKFVSRVRKVGDQFQPEEMVNHFKENALEPYVGICVLLDMSEPLSSEITGTELSKKLEPIFAQMRPGQPSLPPRLILKTKNKQGRFRYLTPDAVEYLFAISIALVGTDAPAMDPPDSPERLIEGLLIRNVMVWLVGLELQDFHGMEPYMLLAAPIQLTENANGPQATRALLVRMPGF